MSVDVEMGIWQKGQAVQKQLLEFLSGPALPLGALCEDLRLVRVEDIGPAQIVVRTIEGRERAEQIFHILGGLVSGDNGVLVKGFESFLPDPVWFQDGLVWGSLYKMPPVYRFLLDALVLGVHFGHQLVQSGL